MLTRSHSERRALLGFSALLTHSTPQDIDRTCPPARPFSSRESIFTPISLTPPPPWVTQALSNLEQGEKELQSLRERQQIEVEEVSRELDNAMIEAQREERRLLEKIERDHREAQRHLSQLKRENAAAVRVVQSLVDQQLRKISQLKEQIHRWGGTAGGANKNQLQRGVAEVTQPWEISLTLKRVNFLVDSDLTNLNLGQVDVREQNMTYPIGVCGIQGQKCALHSGDAAFTNLTPLEIRKEPNKATARSSPDEKNKSSSSNTRVVRKLRLSTSTENEDDPKSHLLKSPLPRRRGASESSQDEESGSICSDGQGQDLVPCQGESQGDDCDGSHWGATRHSMVAGKMKPKGLVLVSHDDDGPSCPPEERYEDKTDLETAPNNNEDGSSFLRRSLADLSPEPHPPSLSMAMPSTESSVDSGTSSSPVGSEDSCYTYVVDRSVTATVKSEHCHSLSTTELSRVHPLVDSDTRHHGGIRKVNRMRLASESQILDPAQEESDRSSGRSAERQSSPEIRETRGAGRNVSRSLSSERSMEEDKLNQIKDSEQHTKEEEEGSTALDSASLVKQFGKLGSGRTDFNLPSGVHATSKGQLFVVDCGNARIQVTDSQKNVVQQVTPSGTERSSRICNYFDVAVNSKGLIALTCAAERAVLVFNRHGRLLQTFGGTTIGLTNEELDAPRGVTVTQQDDFLVADIKRGTLTTLRLEPKTGARLERVVVSGYHRPYLVAACQTTGLMAVSERGNETGRVPCIRVLEPGWNTIRILGVCSGLGPVLTCPWGLCIDSEGDVLVADWGKQHHRVLLYPSKGVGWPLVTDALNSPRGLALLPDGHMVVSDSMNHCIKIYRYK